MNLEPDPAGDLSSLVGLPSTEAESHHRDLEQQPTSALLQAMNEEDKGVPDAVRRALPAIQALVDALVERMQAGGRLFYLGAGTSGRLGIVDASECPPTFGVPQGLVIGLIAGGDAAIRKAVEGAEDNPTHGWLDLLDHQPTSLDTVIGLSASGGAPYVVEALKAARSAGLLTGCIVCSEGSRAAAAAEHPIEVIVGPEFLTGSTRLKSGTAQKLVLNMITTVTMIRLGKVKGNRMVDMQLSNAKLVARGTRMVAEALNLPLDQAKALLLEHGSARKAITSYQSSR